MLKAISLQFQNPDLKLTLALPDEGEGAGPEVSLGEGWSVRLGEGEPGPAAIRWEPDVPWPGRPVQMAEQTAYAVQVEGRVERRRFDLRLNAQSGFFRSFSRREATSFGGTLSWGNFVGWSRLEVAVDGRVQGALPVEVRSLKLDYRSDFRAMLEDLTSQLAALIFDAFRPTAVPTAWTEPGPRTAALDALWLRFLLAPERLPAAFARIAREPRRETRREYLWQDLSRVVQVGPQTVQALVASPERLVPRPHRAAIAPGLPRSLGDRAPQELRVERLDITLDTPENRLVKHTLERLADLAVTLLGPLKTELEREGEAGKGPGWKALLAELSGWIQALDGMRRSGFLAEVGRWAGPLAALPPRVWRQDGYREFAQAWQMLHLTGRVIWEEMAHYLAADLRDMATLYEWWGLFQLWGALRAAAGPLETGDFIDPVGEAWRVRLRPGPVARAGEVTLFYQRPFPRGRGSYSVDLRPDFTLQVGPRLFLFDTKYRAETAEEFGQTPTGERTFERDDLYKMHTYRDAITDAAAAFVLYPGDERRLLPAEGSSDTLSPSFTGVGVLPLRPGHTEPLAACLRALLGR
jgi:predicted component of viral defense system (DUF524 family)